MLNKIFEYFKNEILPYITNINYLIILLGISGTISMIFGGISYFIITEIQDFSLSIIIAGSILNLTALLLSPKSTASFIKGRRGKYGTNSAIMFVCVLTIIILGNSFVKKNGLSLENNAYWFLLDLLDNRFSILDKELDKVLLLNKTKSHGNQLHFTAINLLI